MLTLIKGAFAALAAVGFLLFCARAQSEADLVERGLERQVKEGRADGVYISILKAVGERLIPVDTMKETFRSGETIKVQIENSFDGYLYLINVMPSGNLRLLFPNGDESNELRQRRPLELPAIRFDDEVGTEILRVVISRQPILFLNAVAKKPDGDFDEAATREFARLSHPGSRPRPVSPGDENVAAAGPSDSPGDSRSRDPIIRRSDDTVRRRVLVAPRPQQGKSGVLKPDEWLVFELRLRHT
jgi:hypothetical protein